MRINEEIGREAIFLCVSLLLGIVLFLLYDVLRIFRRIVPHGNLWIGVEDFLYWICCAAAVFVMLYQENDGMVRGFALGGVVVGMMLYYVLFSRLVIRVHVAILKTVLGFLGKIFHFLFHPFFKSGKKMIGFFKKQLKKLFRAIKIGVRKH